MARKKDDGMDGDKRTRKQLYDRVQYLEGINAEKDTALREIRNTREELRRQRDKYSDESIHKSREIELLEGKVMVKDAKIDELAIENRTLRWCFETANGK